MAAKAYLFKIELEGVEPPIWRRFFVPSYISFGMFHEALQKVMGWQNEHMYEFSIDGEEYIPIQDEDGFNIVNVSLARMLNEKNQVIQYRYDFGDDWKHKVTLEETEYVPPEGSAGLFGCLDGARCCPPEDVGGGAGYAEFLGIVQNPDHPEHDETNEWYMSAFEKDEPFDGERFDAAEVTAALNEDFN